MKVSSVVLSTQLQPARPARKTLNPLVRDNMEIVPNLTHVVSQDQKLYFYYEVYDPTLSDSGAADADEPGVLPRKVKVFETPIVERTTLDAPTARPAIFQFAVAGRQVQARPLHLPGQHHRRSRRRGDVPAFPDGAPEREERKIAPVIEFGQCLFPFATIVTIITTTGRRRCI